MPGGSDIALGNEQLDTLLYFSAVTYPTLGANVNASNTLTIPGVQIGDFVAVGLTSSAPAHLNADGAFVSAANTITIWWGTDATGISTGSTALLINVVRPNRIYTQLPSALV